MISKRDAAALALAHAKQEFQGCGEIVINEPCVVENEYAWAFPYNSREFLETGNFAHALMSNPPVLVCKRTGSLQFYSAALSSSEMLAAFFCRRAHGGF